MQSPELEKYNFSKEDLEELTETEQEFDKTSELNQEQKDLYLFSYVFKQDAASPKGETFGERMSDGQKLGYLEHCFHLIQLYKSHSDENRATKHITELEKKFQEICEYFNKLGLYIPKKYEFALAKNSH